MKIACSFLIKICFFMGCFSTYIGLAHTLSFDGLRIPPPKSILIHPYKFFIFENDEQYNNLLISNSTKYSAVYFNNLKIRSDDETIQNDESIEIIIVPSKELDELIKNDQLGTCCNKENLLSGDCQVENTFIKPNINGLIYVGAHLNNSNYFSKLKKGGVYSLMVSNCGNSSNGFIYGELVIKNAHGLLPAIEFMKINLYFFGVVFYTILAIYWIYKCLRNNKQLISMQYYILGGLVLSIISSFLWLQYFRQWNSVGSGSSLLLGISTTINILKLTTVVILTLIASHGVGISKASINSRTRSILIFTTGVIYFFNTLFKEYVVYLRSINISVTSSLLLYSVLPIGILNGIVFFWVFHELVSLLSKLEDDKQTEKLSVYKRFAYILFFTLIIAFAYLLFEFSFYSWDIVKRWRYQWIFQDAIPFFLVSLLKLNLLILWVPKENSKKYLSAEELPAEVIIELETQDLKNIVLKNKNPEYTEDMIRAQIDVVRNENSLISPDRNFEIMVSEQKDRSSGLVILDEMNYLEKNINGFSDDKNKSEDNKENLMHLIN